MSKFSPTARLFEECASRTARLAAFVALPLVLFASTASAETTADVLTGLNGWTGILFGAVRDGSGDSQAGAADTDIVADAQHASLYTGYADSGTVVVSDDKLLFRARVGNPTAPTTFGGVLVVGIDGNLDGRIDLFLSVDGRNSQQAVRLFDPGTGENSSASTTTTSPLPTGWLPNNVTVRP